MGWWILNSANNLVANASTGGQARLDTDDAQHGIPDGSRASLGADGHEARNSIDQIRDVIGRVGGTAVTALAPYEEAISLLEAMDPSRRELGRRLVLVARKLLEDGLGLLGQLFVGWVATGSDDLAVPKKDELLDVGPVAKTQARAAELVIVVETSVFGRQGMRDGGLADVLAVLAEEPLDARLVRGAGGLGVGPAAEGASLVEGQRVPLLGRVRSGRAVAVLGDARELGIDIRIDVCIGHVGVDVWIEVGVEAVIVAVIVLGHRKVVRLVVVVLELLLELLLLLVLELLLVVVLMLVGMLVLKLMLLLLVLLLLLLRHAD
ncbi:hypothetical protein F5X97DRAFT_3271 [Nemania serpens]|nr:hypothetical protein F5X97DRAFT_3271 [Nemania serpens]